MKLYHIHCFPPSSPQPVTLSQKESGWTGKLYQVDQGCTTVLLSVHFAFTAEIYSECWHDKTMHMPTIQIYNHLPFDNTLGTLQSAM